MELFHDNFWTYEKTLTHRMSWWIHDVDWNHKVLFEGFKRPIWELFHKYMMYDLMYNRCLDEYYATVYIVCMYNRCLDEYYATVYVVCIIDV